MRIEVDYDKCQSNAVCMGIAPEIFEVREDGFLYVLDAEPGDEWSEKVIEAMESCPTQAISVIE